MPDIKSLSLYELIKLDVFEAQRHKYRDELKHRLEAENGLPEYLQKWDTEPQASTTTANHSPKVAAFDDEPPTHYPEKPLAETILASGWDFGTMTDPKGASGLTKSIRDGDLTEAMLSQPQLRFWRSIKGKFRKHRGG